MADGDLKGQWDSWLAQPENRNAMLSAGLQLMTGGWGNTTQQIAQAIGAGAESAGRTQQIQKTEEQEEERFAASQGNQAANRAQRERLQSERISAADRRQSRSLATRQGGANSTQAVTERQVLVELLRQQQKTREQIADVATSPEDKQRLQEQLLGPSELRQRAKEIAGANAGPNIGAAAANPAAVGGSAPPVETAPVGQNDMSTNTPQVQQQQTSPVQQQGTVPQIRTIEDYIRLKPEAADMFARNPALKAKVQAMIDAQNAARQQQQQRGQRATPNTGPGTVGVPGAL